MKADDIVSYLHTLLTGRGGYFLSLWAPAGSWYSTVQAVI